MAEQEVAVISSLGMTTGVGICRTSLDCERIVIMHVEYVASMAAGYAGVL